MRNRKGHKIIQGSKVVQSINGDYKGQQREVAHWGDWGDFVLVAGIVAAKVEVETGLMLFLLQQFTSTFCSLCCKGQKTGHLPLGGWGGLSVATFFLGMSRFLKQ